MSRHRGRIGLRGGWTLTYEEDRWWSSWESASRLHRAWELDGVVMTQAEFERVASVRANQDNWDIRVVPGTGSETRAMISGIALSEAEAMAIQRGAHPLALLMPRMSARPLTLEEMMSA